MKKFEYKILNPGGNKTALVIGNDYSNYEKKIINDIILKENKDVEQVGFLSNTENKLEMAGGEFCVNATRCAIWKYLNNNYGKMNIKVSGYKEEIEGGINEKGDVYAKIKIDKKNTDIITIKEKFNYINLDGILLAVMNEDDSKTKLKNLMKTFDKSKDAVGIILLETNGKKFKIYPIIWVKTIDTLYYETACGSGSLAVAIYENYIRNIKNFEIIQPSGYIINVRLNMNLDYVKEAIVSGKVIEEKGKMKYGRI